jgi:hypothetical protein
MTGWPPVRLTVLIVLLSLGLKLGAAEAEDKLWFERNLQRDQDGRMACWAVTTAYEHAGAAPSPWSETTKHRFGNGMAVAFYIGQRAKDDRIRSLSRQGVTLLNERPTGTPSEATFTEHGIGLALTLQQYCQEGK